MNVRDSEWKRLVVASSMLALLAQSCAEHTRDQHDVDKSVQLLGPSPDSDCEFASSAGRDYWFCDTERTWQLARTKCQAVGLDLAAIQSSTENTFIRSHVTDDSWIGASDSNAENAWYWVATNVQFWQGASNGSAVGGAYTNWATGQPNNTSNQDCAVIDDASSAKWSDESCTGNREYVCEGIADACPADPNKLTPGQCGCGNPDTDGDGDGVANCVDGCASDPNKSAAGQCGCGNPDTNSDGDAAADCVDGCAMDAAKTAPGECGCGVADADSDGDSFANCRDLCPNDAARVIPGDCGCANAPLPSGTLCDDGLCAANTQCNGAGSCGTPAQCGAPDGDCAFAMLGNTAYWFCDNDRVFTDARARCQSKGMDLVTIESQDEDVFVTEHADEHSFIGASDQTTEGTWIWLRPGTSFWSGDENGAAVGGAYSNWDSGQPSDSSTSYDCAVHDDGQWRSHPCSNSDAFVCERSDACPFDPAKLTAGICGCGVPDTDSDGNGVADCMAPCGSEMPRSFAGHLRKLHCDDAQGHGSECRHRVQAKANTDYQAAALQYVAQLFSPAEHLALSRDRERKMNELRADPDTLAAVCDGDADGDLVADSVDSCPNTRPLRPTDDVGCEITTLPPAGHRPMIDALLGTLGIVYDPRCEGAETPDMPTVSNVYQVTPLPEYEGVYLIFASFAANQPVDCQVQYQFEVTTIHTDGRRVFTTLAYSSQGDDRVSNDATFGPSFLINYTHNSDEKLWDVDTVEVEIRARAMNGNGQQSAWSPTQHIVLGHISL